MSDETQQRRGYGFWVVFALVLAPLLYTLSVGLGPAAYLVGRAGKGEGTVQVIYAPLIWLHENTPLRKPLDWYVGPWERAGMER
jgi:hypothetical protein